MLFTVSMITIVNVCVSDSVFIGYYNIGNCRLLKCDDVIPSNVRLYGDQLKYVINIKMTNLMFGKATNT